jgi:hypothetical protein
MSEPWEDFGGVSTAAADEAGPWNDFKAMEAGPWQDFEAAKPAAVPPGTPELREAPKEGMVKKALRSVREQLSPLIGPTEEQRWRDAMGVDEAGQPIYKPMAPAGRHGASAEREGLFPALSHPMFPLPRVPDLPPIPLSVVGGPDGMTADQMGALVNTFLGFGEFGESPLGVATAGTGAAATKLGLPAINRLMAGGYAADMARHVPEAASQAGAASVTGTPQQQAEADLGLVANVVLPGTLGAHALAPGKAPAAAAPPKVKAAVSEFGGQPDQSHADSIVPPVPVAPPATAPTVPEKPETLEAQLEWVKQGKRKAVLVTPGAAVPEMPEGMEAHPTAAGVFIYDPKATNPGELDAAVQGNTVGELLGYGVDAKAGTPGETVVVVRSPAGTEKQAVVAAPAETDGAVDAAKAVAGPGDTVGLENGEKVIADRLQPEVQTSGPSRILANAIREAAEQRAPIPASLVDDYNRQSPVPWALPEGYKREGDQFTFTEPKRAETDTERFAREQREANEALRKIREKAAADPDWSVDEAPPAPVNPTERVEAGTPIEMGERPPDIIDWLEGSFRKGIKLPIKAGFGEYMVRARSNKASREMLSLTNGEAADRVLNAMHDEGLWPRIETPEDLAEAVIRAGQERQAWKNRKDKVEAWLDKAIEATNYDPKKSHEGVTGAPVWLIKGGANAALRVAKAAYVTGRDIAQAIAAAVEHVRGMNLKDFNAQELRTWLESALGERETGQKVAGSQATSEETKQAINQYLYETRTNAGDEELAGQIAAQYTPEQLEQVLRDPPPQLHGATWSKLLGEVTRKLATLEREARAGNDVGTATRLAEQQARIWDDALPKITEQAQGLQALNDIVDMSPDAQVARLRRRLDRVADERVNQHQAELDQVQTALQQGKREGAEELRHDPEANAAAKTAVDKNIEDSAETKNAVVMELAADWAQSDRILAMTRERVREHVDELTKADRRPEGLRNVREYARQAMDDLAKRAASIFAGHLQGADPGLDLVEKFKQRLGLSQARAVDLATALSKEWDAQLKAARAKLPKRIAQMRVTRERNSGTDPNSPAAAVDEAIRRQLKEMNIKLGQLLKQEAERQDGTQSHVAERIVQASGLTGEAADTLRNTLKNRWDAIVTDAQRRTLEALQKRSGVPVSKPIKSAFERLIELDRLGALSSEKFHDVVKTALKLKRLTPADAAELRNLVKKVQATPAGFQRQQAAADVLKLTERLAGNMKWWDVPMGIFYANILSGLTTPTKIVLENTNLLVGHTIAALLSRPGELMHPVDFTRAVASSYKRGLGKGMLQAAGTLKTGVISGVWKEPRVPTVLEMEPFGKRLESFNFWKWFSRGISVAHEVTFKPGWEVKQTLLAREVARREGLSGDALRQRVADLMANTPERFQAARAQALEEMTAAGNVSKLELARRTREIVEQEREANMPGSTEVARDFALRTAYLNEPYGFMGLIAKGIRSTLEDARKKYPALGMGVKSQIPFTTIVANILNEKLNWSPVGLVRAAVSHKTGELYGRPIMDPNERAELYTKAIVSTVLVSATTALFGQHIHGNGPGDPRRRKQLQAAGWIPHSIEYNGKYYSYMNTPAALDLAVIGNWLDWHRYGKGNEADGVSRTAFALKATINAIVSQGALDSLKRLFESLGNENTSEGADRLQKQMARTAGSLVFPNLLQQVDRLFDPTVYDQTGMEALLRNQVPFVRHLNKPALTVLGDAVESGPFHYWASDYTEDPLLRTLVEKEAWVPEPSREQIIGDTKRPEYARALTPDEYYNWILQSGKAIRRRLTENIAVLAASEPKEAQKFVRQVAREERAKAKNKLQ